MDVRQLTEDLREIFGNVIVGCSVKGNTLLIYIKEYVSELNNIPSVIDGKRVSLVNAPENFSGLGEMDKSTRVKIVTGEQMRTRDVVATAPGMYAFTSDMSEVPKARYLYGRMREYRARNPDTLKGLPDKLSHAKIMLAEREQLHKKDFNREDYGRIMQTNEQRGVVSGKRESWEAYVEKPFRFDIFPESGGLDPRKKRRVN